MALFGLSNVTVGEFVGGVAGGILFSSIGPEAVPAGVYVGTVAGALIGQWLDGQPHPDFAGALEDGAIKAVGGLGGLGVGIAVQLEGTALKAAIGAGGFVASQIEKGAQYVQNALNQQNDTQAPNQIVANDFNALNQQNGVQTPNQVVANDFDALNQQNGVQTPNQVVANDFDALNQQNGGQTPNQIVANDFNALNATETAPSSGSFNTQNLPAYDIPSSGGTNDGSVFSTGTTPFNSYGQQFTDAYGNLYTSQKAADEGQDLIQDEGLNQGGQDNGTTFGNDYNGKSNDGTNNDGNNSGGYGNLNNTNYANNVGGYGGYGGYSGSGGGGYGYAPIVLDIAGKGINIAKLSSSNTYEDVTGDGYQNRTAWAGVGNGVLFLDTTGTGQLTQANQIIFTKWDPGAKSDMQALLDVFDTNHDGALDAGDADFSKFFVLVSNANGTQTAYSLAALGITSINLNANATNVALPDGSSIDGETTFTMTNPSTGVTTTNVAATVTLAVDSNGYLVATSDTANADGSETVANVASYANGSVAYERVLNTSSDGLSRTLTNLNNGGVVTTIQTDNTVVNGDGSKTETVTNYAGGTILTNGELTASGTSGSRKLNSTSTTTSANGLVVTILRDQLGGGWTTQREVDTTNADGSTSIVISNLNPDGSASNVTTTAVSADGRTRTTTSLVDGNSAESTGSVDRITINGATQTETVTGSVGTTVTSLVTMVTQTAGTAVTRTTTSDLTDGSTLDLTSVAQTVTSSSGSTTTQTDTSGDGTLLDKTVTTNTPQSGGGLVTGVVASELDGFGNLINLGTTTTTISNAGATATTTVVDDSANGTLLSERISTRTVGSPVGSVTVYGNGDGEVTQSQTISVSGGTTTDTVENLNGDGSLVGATVTTTSNGGLSKTTSIDSTGAGTATAPILDHITTDVTTESGGVSTETVTAYGAVVSAGDEISKTQTVVSANGLTTTVYQAFTGASLASGSWDQVTTDQTTVNGDGSLSEAVSVTDGAGHVLETKQKNTSANRQVVTTTTALGTTGLVKTVETVTTEGNGTVQDQVVRFDGQGDVLGATVTTTSADGLTQTIQSDVQGQTAAVYAAHGLAFDSATTSTIVINADGSRVETTNVTSQSGALLSSSDQLTSANGRSVTTVADPYATPHYATQSVDVSTINADGSTTATDQDYSYNGSLIDRTATTTSASGLSKTIVYDLNGDGATDRTTTDVTTINPNGSRTEIVTDFTGGQTNGAVRDITTTTSGIIVQGAGLETTITRQSNGWVPTYQVETITPSANGTITDTDKYYSGAGGALLLQTSVVTSANGLVKTTGTAVNGDTSNDFWTTDATVLNADGSQTETVANYDKAGLISETVTTESANGLSKTTETDANGAGGGSNPVFNSTITDDTVLNSDGSRTETVTSIAANGAAFEQVTVTRSADQQTVTTGRYLDETGNLGTVDQSEVTQTQVNGSVTDTTSSYDLSHTLLGTVVKSTSGNGLSTSLVYENAGGTALDTQTDTTTYDSNGDGGTVETFVDADAAAGLNNTRTRQSTGNNQSSTTTMVLAGALSSNVSGFSVTSTSTVSIADTGATTQTTVDTIAGATSPNDTTTVVTSANRMTTTTSTALGGVSASPYIVQQTAIATDGSKSQTTTYYNPADLPLIENQVTVNTSFDGRMITTTTISDNDQLDQTFDSFTPTFASSSNTEVSTFTKNANGTTTDIISGSGSFGAPSYKQTVTVATNADASVTTTTLNYDAASVLVDQLVSELSPNGLVRSFAYDTTGKETLANLDAAAADIVAGMALPASMLGTDIIESDVKTLNANGSTTEVVKTAYGNSFANQRSLTTTLTGNNGLVTTTYVDNDGSGVYEQFGQTILEPDGSKTIINNFYNDASGTQVINSQTFGSTLVGTNTYTVSADGLITTLTTSSGITDKTVEFANANGSYQYSRTVTSGSAAATNGFVAGSASHYVDANGIDTWSWNSGSGSSGAITIDVATEKQDVAIANEIYQTLLGRHMDDAETQYLAQYITNGVVNREALAFNITNTSEYVNSFSTPGGTSADPMYDGFSIEAALENALGRLPTAEEMATFDQYVSPTEYGASAAASIEAFIPAAVAIAQYTTDQNYQANLTAIDPNEHLVAPSEQWIDPANTVDIESSGTFAYTGYFITVGRQLSSVDVINGSNNVIFADVGSLTVAGFNDAIEVNDGPVSISTSNSSISIEDSNIATVSGNNNQIAQVGPSELTLSGSNDTVYVVSGPLVTGPDTNPYSTTNASNASIIFAAGVGTSSAPAVVSGSGDIITLKGNDDLTVTGANTIVVLGSNDVITASNSTIEIAAGVTGYTINGTGNSVLVPPVVTASGFSLAAGQSREAPGLFSAADPDGASIVTYGLWDTNGNGHWVVNGVIQATNAEIDVTAAQLAATTYVGGYGNDQLWVRAYDGNSWSSWTSFNETQAPAATTPSLNIPSSFDIEPGQIRPAASLVTATQLNGAGIVTYGLFDVNGNGHWVVNGVTEATNAEIDVSAAQLAETTYVGGNGNDELWVRANNGTSWSAWQTLTATSVLPAVAASSFYIAPGANRTAASLFTAAGPDGASITTYGLWDTDGHGHWVVNGVTQATNAEIDVTAAQLAQTTYVGGSGTDQLWVRANDGNAWSAWALFNASQAPPVVTASSFDIAPDASRAASSLFMTADPDGASIVTYGLWDTDGHGHWVVNGVTQATNVEIDVTAAQLAATTYVGGSGTDQLWVRANDGNAWSTWAQFNATQAPPVVTASNFNIAPGASRAASSLFTTADPDGASIVTYGLWDTDGHGHWVVNGVTQATNAEIDVTAAQLAATTYVGGSGTDQLWVRAYDGNAWSTWALFKASQAPPVVTASSFDIAPGASRTASSLFMAADPDGASIVTYGLWDTDGHGHWVVNGVTQATNVEIDVTAAQLAATTYVGGSGTDQLWVRANDGNAWSTWAQFNATQAPPVVTASNFDIAPGASRAASSLFTTADPDGASIVTYGLWDTDGHGHWVVNGVTQATNVEIDVTAAQLAATTYVGGSGTDQLWVRANDGNAWSTWAQFNATQAPPVVTASNFDIAPGASRAASSLFTTADPDSASIVTYGLWDTDGHGHWVVNGVTQATNVEIDVTAAQLAQTTYVGGNGSDQLWVRAYDGTSWSAWTSFTGAQAAPVVTASSFGIVAGQSRSASSLFTITDPNGSSIVTYALWDSNSNGHWVVNGVAQAANTEIDVTAAQLAQTTYVGGGGTDQLYIRVNDGNAWSTWASFTATPELPVVTAGSLTTLSGQAISASTMFSASERGGGTIASYALWDTNGNGHWVVNGVVQATNTEINVTAAQLAETTYVAGNGADQLWVAASDGTSWGNWQLFTVTGAASAIVPAGTTFVLWAAYSGQLTFASATGTLKLENSVGFTGTISGMTALDAIDLTDINFASIQTPVFHNATASGGTLTITDGTRTANITLSGNYLSSTFVVSSDGNGGTTVVDPAPGAPPTIPLTAAEAASGTVLASQTTGSYGVAVTDSAASVGANLDALNSNPHLTSITLTDAGTPVLPLAATQALDDANALGKISNTAYAIDVLDTAANVAANLDALDADASVAALTLTDSGVPTLQLTSAQAAADTKAIAEITNQDYVIATLNPSATAVSNAVFHGTGGTVSADDATISISSNAAGTVTGSNDTIAIGPNGTVTALGSNNTYLFGVGSGHAEIGAGVGSNTGTVDFGPGINANNLWFEQRGNNLEIDVLGSNDTLTIDDWFGGGNNAAVQSFATTDGTKLDAEVQQLVSAMATYATDNPGFATSQISQIPANSELQGAVGAAWHH
ncbi:hemolysin type calcium binding protein [Bradyrhizobium macuxiense]|uniref:Hemolysin type calcium binding protein n=1 Tax=Bradyrhizobium macuxiense TaxID=1755647 RepID=A0A560LXK3_9BRAD|nr:calcium-binding protein [Bradyrhizobium macuxiense]TWC00217.1 hemolysin type calcium binding protein [Bradyrhizobium macuxiense]